MPTDEERAATARGKWPADSPVFLAMAVGTYDTQERGSYFTLNAIHPNLDLGEGLGTGEIFSRSNATPPAAEVEASQPTTEEDSDEVDPAPAGDAPAVEAAEAPAEGAGAAAVVDVPESAPEPAPAAEAAAPALSPEQLPEDWDRLPVAELRKLASELGVDVAPTSPKVGIVNRIRSLLAG